MKKERLITKKESSQFKTLIITIQDSYHSCTYPFRLPLNVSYSDIASVIAKKFKVEIPEGAFFEGDGIEL